MITTAKKFRIIQLLIISGLVLFVGLFSESAFAAKTDVCCTYNLEDGQKNATECISAKVDSKYVDEGGEFFSKDITYEELQKLKANTCAIFPSQKTNKYYLGFSPGSCTDIANASPDEEGGLGCEAATSVPDVGWCRYSTKKTGKLVGCDHIENPPDKINVCVEVPGYNLSQGPGLNLAYGCPSSYDSKLFEAIQALGETSGTDPFEEDNKSNVTTVPDNTKCCVYYDDDDKNGDFSGSSELEECKSPEKKDGKLICESFHEKAKGSPDACAKIDMCVQQEQCCVVYQDKVGSGTVNAHDSGDDTLMCAPATAGCDPGFYYGANPGVNKTPLIRGQVEKKVCGKISACSGKSITASEAKDNIQKEKEANAAKAGGGGSTNTPAPQWTESTCAAKGFTWSAPVGVTEGPYCYVIPDVKLNVAIGGEESTNVAGHVPLIFDLAFVFLAVMGVGGMVGAGYQLRHAVDPQQLLAAKGMMIGSTVALGIGGGSYTLLQTVSPAAIEGRIPPVVALLPNNFSLSGLGFSADSNSKTDIGFGERLCCKGKLCLVGKQVKAGDPVVYTLPNGETFITKASEAQAACKPISGNGEYCRPGTPQEMMCNKNGGVCILALSDDPKKWGACAEAYKGILGNSIVDKTMSAGAFLASWTPPGALLEGVVGVHDLIESSIPGEGPIGACWTKAGNTKNGGKCSSNSECKSKKCARYPGTAGCWKAAETGYCTSGKPWTKCAAGNLTLGDGVNNYTEKKICNTGLQCKYAADEQSDFSDHNYECSDGSLGSACGTPSIKKGSCIKIKDEFEKKLQEAEKALVTAEDNPNLKAKYEADIKNLTNILKTVDPNAKKCEYEDGGAIPDHSICQGDLKCRKVSGKAGNHMRCLPATIKEGSECISKTDLIERPDTCKLSPDVGIVEKQGLDCKGGGTIGGVGFCSTETQNFGATCKITFKNDMLKDKDNGSVIAPGCGVKPEGGFGSLGLAKGGDGEPIGMSVCYQVNESAPSGKCGWFAPAGGNSFELGYPMSDSGKVYLEQDKDKGFNFDVKFKGYSALCNLKCNPVKTYGYSASTKFDPNMCPAIECTNALKGISGVFKDWVNGSVSVGGGLKKNVPDVLGEDTQEDTFKGAFAYPVCMTKNFGGVEGPTTYKDKIGNCSIEIRYKNYGYNDGAGKPQVMLLQDQKDKQAVNVYDVDTGE